VPDTGLAYDREEYALGMCCIGAPVFDVHERVVAGLGLTGLTSRCDAARQAACAPLVLACAQEVAVLIGYAGDRYRRWLAAAPAG
jgi:DNA-binding IclR family transcriptional regulator